MNLHLKLFIPALLLLATIASTMHFYWLPNYLALEQEEHQKNELAFADLLGTALIPDLLNNDLAQTHAILNRVLENRKYWYVIELHDHDQQKIYPLATPAMPDKTNIELLEQEIFFNGEKIAHLKVWIDISASSAQRITHIHRLEQIILMTLLIAALIATLLQDRWIKSPLQQLAQFASDTARGNYDANMEYQSHDEVGKLVDAFRRMRKQIQQRENDLVESQNLNKAVIESAVDGIISIDSHGIIMSFNPAAETIFGYKPDYVIGKNINILMPKPYQDEHDGYLQNYLNTGEKKIIGIGREVEGLRNNGSTFPLDLAIGEIKLGDRRLFIGTIRDITERKHNELQNARYANALEKLHVIALDTESEVNKKFHDVLELGRHLFKMPLGIISHVSDKRYIVEYIVGTEDSPPAGSEFKLGETYCCHTLEAETPIGFEHVKNSRIKNHPCYKSFALEAYIGTPIFVNGKVYGTLNFSSPQPYHQAFSNGDYNLIQLFAQFIGSEITRIQAETALYNSTALRQAMLDSANFSIISTDVDGTILIFNKGAERLLGYKAEELVNKQTPAILHDPEEVLQRAQELSEENGKIVEPGFEVFANKARAGIADEREWTYIRKDGSRFPVMLSITAAHNVNGDIIGYLGIGSDLTERKKIDLMKNEFISTVSHELRTPLTSIRGALSLILGKGAAEFSPRLLRMLETANRNSERLTYLINDILDLEKINAGKLELHLVSIDLKSLAERAVEENQGYAHSHNVKLKLSIVTDDDTTVNVDEHRLLQVFANLISNAVKYSPKNDTVNIRIQRVDHKARISVSDNGSGIPAEFRSRIFGRFAQADSSDTREKGGTGLGLTITRAIIEQLGGHIDFNSEAGKGTEFFFELPTWKRDSDKSGDDDNQPQVLVCEDDIDIAYVLTSLLEQEGLYADIAATAAAARELLSKKDYQLLLLDLKLPDAHGLDLIRILRKTEKNRDLPIIVVSGQADESRKQFNGDALTVADWMQKPIDMDRLTQSVAATIRGNKRPNILHVEDDLDIIQITQALFENNFNFDYATTISDARKKLGNNAFDLVILDITLPDGSGLDLLDLVRRDCPVVLFSAHESSEEINSKVAATLLKSRSSNSKLMKTVTNLLKINS